jgi:hypothetical protein
MALFDQHPDENDCSCRDDHASWCPHFDQSAHEPAKAAPPDQHPDENGRGCPNCTGPSTPHACPWSVPMPEPRGTAVEVWRHRQGVEGAPRQFGPEHWSCDDHCTRGVWRSQAEDALLLGVVEAAEAYLEWDGNRNGIPNDEGMLLDTRKLIDTRLALINAIAALDAWRPTA